MRDDPSSSGDSEPYHGGQIPGSAGVPAFSLAGANPSPIPVLIAVPHAGRAYPGSLLERMRNPGFAALRLEDRYADQLARRVADATGAALLVAQAPRASCCASAANAFCYRRRQEAGYVDSLTTSPSGDVTLGTIQYGGALYRQRGSIDVFAHTRRN